MKTKLNCTTVTIRFSRKEMRKIKDGDVSLLVSNLFGKMVKKFPEARFSGKWDMQDNKIIFPCERKEACNA